MIASSLSSSLLSGWIGLSKV